MMTEDTERLWNKVDKIETAIYEMKDHLTQVSESIKGDVKLLAANQKTHQDNCVVHQVPPCEGVKNLTKMVWGLLVGFVMMVIGVIVDFALKGK